MLEFYFILISLSTFGIFLSRNIIQSLLYLIFVFLLTSILFIYLGADFLGLVLLIVYIGAIAVLFLFVIMMLNVRFLEFFDILQIYFFLGILLCSYFIGFCLYYGLFIFFFNDFFFELNYINWVSFLSLKIISIGELLFNDCYLYFFGATLLLFIAMIGSICLALDKDFNISSIKSSKNNIIFTTFYWNNTKYKN